ncbi:MAG TPA: DsrE/DsrF/DrsH-like family protein [Thermoplasmata archaeon]|nr:DsrE/DsrF/DrsH-like family protein [Thermoplasmata archaeon]
MSAGMTAGHATATVESAKREGKKSLVLVMSKGGADMAYPALILATTARALGMDAHIYFTFWGMQLLTPEGRKKSMDVFPPDMQKAIAAKFPSVEQFMQQAKQAGVHIHACSPTMDMFGMTKAGLVHEVDDVIGASTYLELASHPDALTLFI